MRAVLYGLVATALVWSGPPGAAGQTQTLPPQVSAVQKYILDKEYPELFGDKSYRTKIENAVVADLDGDGQGEVILHFTPHYRQSPTIMIYRVAPDMKVTRVREGLAPGPLQPLSDEFLDSHAVGEGVDFDIAAQQTDAVARQRMIDAMLAQSSSIVAYPNFFHMDTRKGAGVYIDMTALPTPPKTKNCENFQFSKVKQIGVGSVPTVGAGNVLAAWADSKVYLYRVKSFVPSGLLDKQLWTVDVAADFKGFAPGSGGPLNYVTPSGAAKPFVVQCSGDLCAQKQ